MKGVDWPGVLRTLLQDAPPGTRRTAAWYAENSRWLRPGQITLAVLVVQASEAALAAALGHDQAAADWTRRTARLALATVQELPVRHFSAAGTLHLHPDLQEELPFLAAARTVAEVRAGRLAVYLTGDLPPAAAGRCRLGPVALPGGRRGQAAIIELDHALDPGQITDTWRHEVAHLVDPGFTLPLHQRTGEEREAFADALAARLQELHPDTPWPALQPLVHHTYAAVRARHQQHPPRPAAPPPAAHPAADRQTDAEGWPPPGLPSLAVWSALPLDQLP